jgi:DNA-binding LacI/PurR family transcriptional regulator
MRKRITVRDIAEKVNVHFTTVALALKNDPRVKAATRAKVQQAAKAMGYVPDPMLSALSAYRSVKQRSSFHELIAWITNWPTRDEWLDDLAYRHFYEGSRLQAEKFGYKLEPFWLKEPGMTARRASNILYNRGIRGLLICPLPISRGHLSLEWERFSTVAFAYSMQRPKVNVVATAHYAAVITALRRMRGLGYKRIGWVNESDYDERVDRLWKAGFWSGMHDFPQSENLPPLSARPLEKKSFLRWFKTHQPEAILTTHDFQFIIDWLQEVGCKVPKDVGVAFVNLQETSRHSGVLEQSQLIGRTAVDQLLGMLQRGERGLPEIALRTLVEGAWNEGSTLRKISDKTSTS